MTTPASHPAVAPLLARLVGPLSLATQDAVRRWGLAFDAGAAPGAEETPADGQGRAPDAGATPRGRWGASAFVAGSPAGLAPFAAADQLLAAALAGAPIPVSGAIGLDVAAGPGLGVESTAAELPIAGTGSADFLAVFPVATLEIGGGESGAPAGRRLHAPPPQDLPTTSGPTLFSGVSPGRRDGETPVAEAAALVPRAVQNVGADFATAPLGAFGEWSASSAAALPPQPAPPAAPATVAAAAVDFRPGTVPSPIPVTAPIAPVSTSDVGVSADQGRLHPSEPGPILAEARPVLARQIDHVAAATLQSPRRAATHRDAAASSATGSDRQPDAAAAGAANVDVVAAPAPAAVTSMRWSPGASPPLVASAAGLLPAAMIRLRATQQPLPIPVGSRTGLVEWPPASPPAGASAPGESGLGTASAPTASTLTASPAYRAVAARLDRALAPVFARALAASGGGAEAGDPPLVAEPAGQTQGAAPTQVSNTFNVKVALGGSATAGDVRQIEDALADWLRDSARRQGLIG
jgi:hypothetical protein